MKKISGHDYPYYMKRLQITAILILVAVLLYKAIRAEAHVDLHWHSIRWEAEQRAREEQRERTEEYIRQRPDLSEAEKEDIRGRTEAGALGPV